MRVPPSIPRGFTLFELLIVLALTGVLIGIAVPNLTQFMRSNQMTSAANDMLVAIHLARAESVKRRLPTGVMNLVTKPAGNAGYVAFRDTGFVKVAADDLSGVVLCDAKKGNVMQGGAEVSTARGLLISAVGRPSVTRNVNTIASNADLLNNGSCP